MRVLSSFFMNLWRHLQRGSAVGALVGNFHADCGSGPGLTRDKRLASQSFCPFADPKQPEVPILGPGAGLGGESLSIVLDFEVHRMRLESQLNGHCTGA